MTATPDDVKPRFIAVDFFCGAGGTTRGLIDAGGYVSAGIDHDRKCELTYVTNNPNTHGDQARPDFLPLNILPATPEHPDGQQFEVRERVRTILQKSKARWPGVPLLFAITAPCQPFTKLTKIEMTRERMQERHRDSNLLLESAKFVEWFRPDIVFAENVSGIRSDKYGGVWDSFEEILAQLGYVVGSRIVCASKFGIPQIRKRAVLLAVRKAKLGIGAKDVEGLRIPDNDPEALVVTVREAIGHLPPISAGRAHPSIPNHRTRGLSTMNLKRIAASVPGESNKKMHSTEFGDLSLECHADLTERQQNAGFTDVYTRMHPDRPSPTITTKCHSITNGRFGHYDPNQLRGISLREAAILQSFPENYVFYPTEQVDPIAKMIGNAVPPKLACFFASYALTLIETEGQQALAAVVIKPATLPFINGDLNE